MTYSVMRLPGSEGAGTDIIGFGSGIGDELIGAPLVLRHQAKDTVTPDMSAAWLRSLASGTSL